MMTDRRGGYQRQGGRGGSPRQSGPAPIDRAILSRIISDPGAAQELVQEAQRLGQELARPLSTSQIRSLFGEVRQIEADWRHNPERAHRRLILLKPKMAYRAKKEAGDGVTALVSVLDPAVDYVQGDAGNFRRFVEFFEAILAYHKASGGN